MYKQDKATTERHAKMLRELVKRPENKVCADCKRNDARWASWNIGVFICIRCSGIHRSMGTHISKVKSVDLDTWNVEQMESIQRWGNHRANLYWEAHLRPGHIPPEHKVESFIRSKYESRRWAREGPPPSDPSILESAATDAQENIPSNAEQILEAPAVTPTSPVSSPHTTRQPIPHQLLSAATVSRPLPAQPLQATSPPPAGVNAPAVQTNAQNVSTDLFSLDFHTPSTPSNAINRSSDAQKTDVKSNILSLFSTPAVPASSVAVSPPIVAPQTELAAANDPFALWSQQPQVQQQAPPVTSMIGSNGTGMWGVQSGWAPPVTQSAQNAVWGAFSGGSTLAPTAGGAQKSTSTNALFETSNVWGGNAGNTNSSSNGSSDLFSPPFSNTLPTTQKKDDVFGDLWGDFK